MLVLKSLLTDILVRLNLIKFDDFSQVSMTSSSTDSKIDDILSEMFK